MATTPLHALPDPTTFPTPGVAAGIQRAVAAACERGPRPDGAGHTLDRAFIARRLHVVRRESIRRVARVAAPSVSA